MSAPGANSERGRRTATARETLNWPGLARATVVFGPLAVLPLLLTAHWVVNLLVFTLMYAALASAWNVVGGYAGYPSLGHAAFFGIGAYAIAITFSHHGVGSGYLPFAALPLVGLASAVVALPVGWVAMRTRADVFAIVTITLLFIVQVLAFNLHGLTGGAQGVGVNPPPFSVDTFERPFYYAMLALLGLAVAISYGIMRSKLGLSLAAVRADEDKARGVGVRVTGVKLLAFAVSVGIAAMVGGVWAYYIAFVYPQFAVDPLVTIGMVLMAFLGGKGTLWGPVLGAFILVPAQQYLAYRLGATEFYLIGYAAIFLVVMLLLPRGILPSLRERWERWPARRASSRPVRLQPALPPPAGAVPDGPGPAPGALLEVVDLAKRFGGIAAVTGCSFAVEAGSITGLIGPNGSGKTTAFNLITGYLRPDSGRIVFAGRPVRRADPGSLYRRGLSRTFQQARVFPELSVEENLIVASGYSWPALFRPRRTAADRARAGALLAEFRLAELAGARAAELSYGQRKLLEFAAVLMSRPRLVLLDEPTAGVNPVLIETMERHIRERNAAGTTFLVVEHDMGFVMRLCDPVIVLDGGAPIATGPPAAVQGDPLVLAAYLGE